MSIKINVSGRLFSHLFDFIDPNCPHNVRYGAITLKSLKPIEKSTNNFAIHIFLFNYNCGTLTGIITHPIDSLLYKNKLYKKGGQLTCLVCHFFVLKRLFYIFAGIFGILLLHIHVDLKVKSLFYKVNLYN